jgi:signal transduction histidine kinase
MKPAVPFDPLQVGTEAQHGEPMTSTGRIPQEPQDLLLELFQKVGGNADAHELPDVPLESFPEGSEARQLFEAFAGMLARMKEKEDALRRTQQNYEQLVNSLDGIMQERTRELSTLLEVSHNVTSTLDLTRLVSTLLDQLKVVAEYTGSAILLVDGHALTLLDVRGANPDAKAMIGRKVSLDRLGSMWPLFRSGEPVILDDVRGNDLMSKTYREVVAELLETTGDVVAEMLNGPFGYDRSFLAIPIRVKEQVIGLFTLTHNEPGFYTSRHAGLAMAVANQAALAIENARLYNHAQQASRSTAALAQIASRVAYGGSLQKTLNDICQHVVVATGAAAAGVVLYDDNSGTRSMVGSFGLPEGYMDAVNAVLGSGTVLFAQAAFDGYKPVVTNNTRQKVLESEPSAPLHPFMPTAPWDTVVAVPMIYHDKQLGVLASYMPTTDIEESELAFHTAIADQTAVAVEHARLLAEVHDKATLEQRQHLARELHDSVSQALFSINLTARAVEALLKRENPQTETAFMRLTDLRQLTQAALAEMRALIFELRPRALEEEGLLQAIRKHGSAVAGRAMLQVSVVCPSEDQLPRLKPAAEEALYRIAQEALHNVVKHARATRVEILLDYHAEDRVVSLSIADNGVGFDQSQVPAGHMGLGTMGQRAASLGAEYTVDSRLGVGTTVTVRVPLAEWRLAPAKAPK